MDNKKTVAYLVIFGLSFPLYYYITKSPGNLLFLCASFIVGIFLLVRGSDLFVEGASSIAAHKNVSEHTIGLTLVALATSLPEFAVSTIASFYHHPETSWGNVVGSNIANIGLVLGIAAIIMPLRLSRYIKRDAMVLLGSTAMLILFSFLFGVLVWWMGVILIIVYLMYLAEIKGREEEVEDVKIEHSVPISVLLTIFGAFGVVWGADVVVTSAVDIANVLGIPELVIAITAVAVGTSLPELATTIAATVKRKHGIAVGNVIGSNIFNTCMVLGVSSAINPITISQEDLIINTLFLAAMTVALFLFSIRNKITTKEGLFFLLFYAVFIGYLVIYV